MSTEIEQMKSVIQDMAADLGFEDPFEPDGFLTKFTRGNPLTIDELRAMPGIEGGSTARKPRSPSSG